MEDVVVVGAGQAGLAVSYELNRRGVAHVVLEKGEVGQTWRGHWRNFCLVTPNWSMGLPGRPYDGEDPDGFEPRDEIVAFLERYAGANAAPVRAGVEVTALAPAAGGFRLATSAGEIEAARVVLCTGAYQRPQRPAAAASLPADLLQIDVEGYVDPASLPAGPVLVVGSGQSGCQIAEELHEAGRDVFLSCGRAPWAPRRIGDRDLFWWLEESGFLAAPTSALPDLSARLFANILVSGHGGGHDMHLRTLHEQGVRLLGHFDGSEGRQARFRDDLSHSLAWGDERHGQLRELFGKLARERDLPAPEMPEPAPPAPDTPERVDLSGFGAVLFAGVHFLRTRKSALLIGVGDDAAVVAAAIAAA